MKILAVFWMSLSGFILSENGVFANVPAADTVTMRGHLKFLTEGSGYRNYLNPDQLNKIASYIYQHYSLYADTVYYQEFVVDGQVYKNVIASFGQKNKTRIVVGAHYDVCGNQAGADDNASGVTGLLELARMLNGQKLHYRIDLVAFSLEEPPYFRTDSMGSYIHAQSLVGERIFGMISLEMIGFFNDEKKSQTYPAGILKMIYGGRGNYITLVKKSSAGKFARQFSKEFKRTNVMRTKKFTGRAALPGIDFSDHLNYWKFGISAMMITDTAFYRNKNYHESTDTLETLDLKRMANVIDGVFTSLVKLK
jgi:hypothetical protein